MLKRVFLLLIILVPALAFGQSTTTLPNGTTSYTPQFRYFGNALDSLKQVWVYSGSKFNRWYTATEIEKRFVSNQSYLQKIDSLLAATNVWNGSNIFGDTAAKVYSQLFYNVNDQLASWRFNVGNTNINLRYQPGVGGANRLMVFGSNINGPVQGGEIIPYLSDLNNRPDSTTISNTYAKKLTGDTTEINYPAGFKYRPFRIFYKDGKYSVSQDYGDIIKVKMRFMQSYHANYQTGKDSIGYGLTQDKPAKTIQYLYNTTGARLIFAHGVHRIDTWGSLNTSRVNTDDFFVVGDGADKTFITSAPATLPTFTLNSGNTYVATQTNVISVVDMAYTNKEGYRLRLDYKTSVADVDANAGSYFVDGTSVYVHLSDNRAPDANVLPIQRLANSTYNANAGTHGVFNITFMGGGSTTGSHGVSSDSTAHNSTAMMMAENCAFMYAQNSNYDSNGGEGVRNLFVKYVWLKDCDFYGNARDGANGQSDPSNPMNVVEINNTYHDNGLRLSSRSVNASSYHEISYIIRIGGKGWNNSGPNFADVNGAQSFNIGMKAFKSASVIESTYYNTDFQVNSAVATPSKMWVVNSQSSGSKFSFNKPDGDLSTFIIDTKTVYTAPYAAGITFGNYTTSNEPLTALPSVSTYTANTSLNSGDAAGGDLTGTYPNPTLKTVNSNVGTFNGIPSITLNAKGLTTAISTVNTYMSTNPSIATTVGTSLNTDIATTISAGVYAVASGSTNKAFSSMGALLNMPATSTIVNKIGFDRTGNSLAWAFSNGTTQSAWNYLTYPTNGVTLTAPATSQTIVGTTATQTLSNKTLDGTNTAVTQTQGDNSTKLATTNYTGSVKTFTASGNGVLTTITIPHGLTGITATSRKIINANNLAASGFTFATIDATNVYINYTVAPASGTNNLSYDIHIIP